MIYRPPLKRGTGLLLLTFTLAACGSTARPAEMASVNGHAITKQDYQTLLRYTLNYYRWGEPNSEYYTHDICGMRVFARPCRTIQRSLLTRMIDQELVRQYAVTHKLSLTTADRRLAIAEETTLKHKIGGSLAFQVYLQKLQTTPQEFRRIEEQQILTSKVMNAVVPFAISGPQVFLRAITIPIGGPLRADAALHARYVRRAQARAAWLAVQVRAGRDFGSLARKYAADPAERRSGGNIGWLAPLGGDPQFARAIFALPLHRMAVISSGGAYHMIEVMDRQTLPYTGAALTAERQHRFAEWIRRQLKSATVTISGSPA